jgi:hypothetical protein
MLLSLPKIRGWKRTTFLCAAASEEEDPLPMVMGVSWDTGVANDLRSLVRIAPPP